MDASEQRTIYTVSEITAEIKQAVETLGIVWVQGELSNFKHHSSGHMYFTLKDDRAQIRAACFRNQNRYLKFRPEDGLEVIARGRLSVYEPRGDYQIIVETMEPRGIGTLQLAFEQLKEKLHREGLFDEARKAPLPMLPEKIGIVTSPTGAAIRDMLRILERRNACLHVLLYPAKVQGTGAASEIASGVRYFNTREDIDVIIVGRGGGSMEDLWAFNEEEVARAIFESRVPVISAVGHEIDYTIADFVADLRAPTPSAAAELVSAAREELKGAVGSLDGRMVQSMRLQIERRRLKLERLAQNRAFNIAPNMIRDFQQRFDEATLRMGQALDGFTLRIRHRCQVLDTRLRRVDLRQLLARRREAVLHLRQGLHSGMKAWLRLRRSSLELAAGRLQALSPLQILERGYSICRTESKRVLRDAGSVSPGEMVEVTLSRGALDCRVEKILPGETARSPKPE